MYKLKRILRAVVMCVGDVLSPTIHLMFVGLMRQFVMAVNRRGISSGHLKSFRRSQSRGFRTATKILVYKAVILTTLVYGCETWVAYRRHVKVLEQFQQRILRAILGVHWQDRILEQADTTSIEAHIVRSQLSWAGHVRRMSDTRRSKQLLFGELSSGKRKTGGQWKRYKDQLKANLKKCEMDLQWETTADDRA